MSISHFHPLVQAWFNSRFTRPTPAQEQGWPAILKGTHTLISAPTGSGKTLAALKKDVQRLLVKLQVISIRYIEAIPEAEQLLEAQQWCNVWTQVFKTLEDIEEDSIDNAKEDRKSTRLNSSH